MDVRTCINKEACCPLVCLLPVQIQRGKGALLLAGSLAREDGAAKGLFKQIMQNETKLYKKCVLSSN